MSLTINPCKEKHKKYLFDLLNTYKDETFFETNETYLRSDGTTVTQPKIYYLSDGRPVTLNHYLLKRTRHIEGLNQAQIKYDVFDQNPLANGNYGVVILSKKTITKGRFTLWIKDDENHITKMTSQMPCSSSNLPFKIQRQRFDQTSLHSLNKEKKYLELGDRNHPKYIQHYEKDFAFSLNFLTSRKFDGETLHNILRQERDPQLNIEQRFRLTIALLRAYKKTNR